MSGTLDILICTYNRPQLLKECLLSLACQQTDRTDWNIIIINNYHQPFDQDLFGKIFTPKHVHLFEEPVAGLSRARNKGIQVSTGQWIGFLDDDAKVDTDYIQRAFDIIETSQFDCFGGHIKSWWPYGRPRWLSDDFGSKPLLTDQRSRINQGYNWGSHLFIKKAALEKIKGFPVDTGIKGTRLGYGAENVVQDKLRKHGYIIGYDPNFCIDHAVLRQKLHLRWHLHAAYVTGRDGRAVFKDQYALSGYLKSARQSATAPFKAIYKWISIKDFYWENMLLDAIKPSALLIGKIRSLF